MLSFEGNFFIFKFRPSHKKLETTLLYGENPESLSHLGLDRYRVVTDRQTDGQNYDS